MTSISDRWAADEETLEGAPLKMLAPPRWKRDELAGYDEPAPLTMDDFDEADREKRAARG